MTRLLLAFAALFLATSAAFAETVRFTAADGVVVTADFQKPSAAYDTVLVLYHMAGASRGEYGDIAKRLNELGYATLAVDQRSGGKFNGVKNETAAKAGGNVAYTEAIPDMQAASAWARKNAGARHVGVLGSSYSAGLVLVLAAQDRKFADAVMAFSPGEYFGGKTYVTKRLGDLKDPVFLTSARNEAGQWKPFASKIAGPVTGFQPDGRGRHGASALVSADGAEYWAALTAFLATHLPAKGGS
ncbi:CocE/NonD family hydrolase [Ruegeria lacuscaerulensis]|uniref:CocE/NonD family hydrolase n=1 Tax=Ruegeria lacuscaerulensis TaxID=55218 RepID=UPI00147D95BE|nr:CocE/NonD family hydrolase [Ruegeria lacuscaerulensis]